MITQARIALRIQRFEILAVTVASLIVGVSAVVVRLRLDAVAVPAECWRQWFGNLETTTASCTTLAQDFLSINEAEGGKVMAAMAILPLFVGLFLGTPVVAREIETGTAPTVWALAGSRSRWLLGRMAVVAVVLAIGLGILAIASEVLWLGREPWAPIPNFGDAGLHGPGVVARGMAVLGLAMLAGAILGRTLPATIAGVVLCLLLYVGASTGLTVWLQAESLKHVTRSTESAEVLYPGGTMFWQGWLAPDGTPLFSQEQALRLAPDGVDAETWFSTAEEDGGPVSIQAGVPGSSYPSWSLFETGVFTAIGLVGLGLTFLVVDRRRPL